MAFKQRSSGPFKMMGSSPVKQYKKPTGPRAEKKYNSGKTTSKSDADLFIARSTEVKNPRTGENLATEYMESGSKKKGYRIPVTKGKEKRNMGLYTVKDKETGKEVPVDPRDESIAPSNVVKGVKAGRSYQKAFKKYNKSRKSPAKQIPGDTDDKKIHQTKGFMSDRHTFTKGARAKGGKTTVERGKKTEYVPQGNTYVKRTSKKKKGSAVGAGTWEVTKTKDISSKKANRQIARKSKRYTSI